MSTFNGKRALVTGAGKGIGRETAILLSSLGAQVVAISRTQADLQSLQKEIECQTITADLSDVESARYAANQAREIDLLVDNAGIIIMQPFLDTTIEAFDLTLATILRAVLIVSQIIARKMIKRGQGGAIVNVSSQASMRVFQEHTSYCASKGALDQLTRRAGRGRRFGGLAAPGG